MPDPATSANITSLGAIFRGASIPRGLLAGVVLIVGTIVVHGVKSNIVGGDGPPELTFFLGISACLVVSGFLLTVFHSFVHAALPGNHWVVRGLWFGFLVWGSVWFGNFIGSIGRDFEGGFDILSHYKTEHYATFIADTVNLTICCLFLAFMARKEACDVRASSDDRMPRMIVQSLIGIIIFPAAVFATSKLSSLIVSRGYEIPEHARLWHDVGVTTPLLVTGLFIPLLYGVAHRRLDGRWQDKGLLFANAYFLTLWLPNNLFLLPLGFGLDTVFYFAVVVGVPIYLWIGFCAYHSRQA